MILGHGDLAALNLSVGGFIARSHFLAGGVANVSKAMQVFGDYFGRNFGPVWLKLTKVHLAACHHNHEGGDKKRETNK